MDNRPSNSISSKATAILARSIRFPRPTLMHPGTLAQRNGRCRDANPCHAAAGAFRRVPGSSRVWAYRNPDDAEDRPLVDRGRMMLRRKAGTGSSPARRREIRLSRSAAGGRAMVSERARALGAAPRPCRAHPDGVSRSVEPRMSRPEPAGATAGTCRVSAWGRFGASIESQIFGSSWDWRLMY